MATVTTQASAAMFRPWVSRSRFLTGSSGGLKRVLSIKPMASSSTTTTCTLKIEANKGEWSPGLSSPGYLDGSLPGDNGFDPLGLAEDPENLKWFVQAEGERSMADAGCSRNAITRSFYQYWDNQCPKMIRRWQDIKNTGSVNQDPILKQYSLPPNECGYPRGIFNPLNFAPTLEAKEKEIANGRLAMLAFLGFVVQHNVTGKGPFDNLLQHVAEPWHNTIIQTLSGN